MNITSNAGVPAKSLSDTVWLSTLISEKSGAFVPSGNMVLGVRAMGVSNSICPNESKCPGWTNSRQAASIRQLGVFGNGCPVSLTVTTGTLIIDKPLTTALTAVEAVMRTGGRDDT